MEDIHERLAALEAERDAAQEYGQRWRRYHDAMTVRAERAEAENQKLRAALIKARGYVEEPGAPGTIIETTQESAERSVELLSEIDTALNKGNNVV